MKKVGIMSMQRIANYGSFLQAYALKKQLIEEQGAQVEFVDYHVGIPVVKDSEDASNKLIRKIKKGVEIFNIMLHCLIKFLLFVINSPLQKIYANIRD